MEHKVGLKPFRGFVCLTQLDPLQLHQGLKWKKTEEEYNIHFGLNVKHSSQVGMDLGCHLP